MDAPIAPNTPHPLSEHLIQLLVHTLSQALTQRQWQIACVESCTGGGLMQALTEPAGASAWFYGGFVTYDNQAKIKLGVSAQLLESHGAVSREVAQAMSQAAYTHTQCPLIIAITGIAGPAGGSAEKPVGRVWIDLLCQGQHHTHPYLFARSNTKIMATPDKRGQSGRIQRVGIARGEPEEQYDPTEQRAHIRQTALKAALILATNLMKDINESPP